MNYYETYAPVVTWFAIRLMIIFGILFQWSLHQVDFIMAYPQAPIEMDIYMELPQGIESAAGKSKDHVLKLLKNIYGQKQAGHVWNEYLIDRLNSIGFKQSLTISYSSSMLMMEFSLVPVIPKSKTPSRSYKISILRLRTKVILLTMSESILAR